MPTIRLSRAAENDLRDIAIYTLDNWAKHNRSSTSTTSKHASKSSPPTRSCAHLGRGLRRWEHGRHIIFYRPKRSELHVARILHVRMLAIPANFPTA